MKTVLIITGALILAFAVLYLVARSKIKNTPVVEDNDDIIKLTDKNFDHQTKNKVVLVDFWAEWCGPCKMIAPILDEIATEYEGKLTIAKLNIDENPATAPKFGIRGIPTLLLFKNGAVAATKVGALSKTQLKEFLDANL